MRKRVNEYIIKGVENPTILTMPADKWIWEKELLGFLPESTFCGVERDWNVYLRSKKIIQDESLENCSIAFDSILETLKWDKRNNFSYSHAILDYCGTINTSYEDIKLLIEGNLIKVNGIAAITFSKNGFRNAYGYIGDYLDDYPNTTGLPNIVYATRGIINQFIKNSGDRYSLEEIIQYYDTSSMMVFILKRNA